MATLLKDDAGVPIPQYMNSAGNGFEGMTGKDGAINAQIDGLIDALAAIKTATDATTSTVNELKEAVSAIKTLCETLTADNVDIKVSLATIATNTTPTTTE